MKEAIKKAIEGGYAEHLKKEYDALSCNHTKPFEKCLDISDERMVLDPLFWQCLGKAEGWDEMFIAKKPVFQNESIAKYFDSDSKQVKKWKVIWHHFIDWIANGKSIDEFFNQLLT